MAIYGEYFVLNKPTKKSIKRLRRKLARRCAKKVRKVIKSHMNTFFIEKTADEMQILMGRQEGSMTIGWKVILPTIEDINFNLTYVGKEDNNG